VEYNLFKKLGFKTAEELLQIGRMIT